MPFKSVLLERYERFEYFIKQNKIINEEEFNLNNIDYVAKILEYDDPLMLKERSCNLIPNNLLDISICKLIGSERFKHMRPSSFYE